MNVNGILHLMIPSWKQNLNFTKYITKKIKFRSFWITSITLKKLTVLKDFRVVLNVSRHRNLYSIHYINKYKISIFL